MIKKRVAALVNLGNILKETPTEALEQAIYKTERNNPWFTKDNCFLALKAISEHFLSEHFLLEWLSKYTINEPKSPARIGLIPAGNIPLVGFHDWLCVFLTGHRALVKLSDKDPFLLPYLYEILCEIAPEYRGQTQFIDRLTEFEATIATGSDNSARYFSYYFGKKPHIIRQNRQSVAVLSGDETDSELHTLGKDIFRYFGLGCRNVSKIYVPHDYNFEPLLENLHHYNDLVLHNKYKNNFDYNFTLVILNQKKHLNNGCIILLEDQSLASRIAILHYEYYTHLAEVEQDLLARQNELQCVVSKQNFSKKIHITPFGKSQEPELWDYADGVDTITFLTGLTT